jgi:hypothetical protein
MPCLTRRAQKNRGSGPAELSGSGPGLPSFKTRALTVGVALHEDAEPDAPCHPLPVRDARADVKVHAACLDGVRHVGQLPVGGVSSMQQQQQRAGRGWGVQQLVRAGQPL